MMFSHSQWPVDPGVLVPFLIAVALVELTPGPNMGWLGLVSAAQGRLAGFSAVLGITLGLAFWMVASVAGLTELLLLYPAAFQVIRWAGIGFMLWLAWDAWSGRGLDPAAADGAPTQTLRALFSRGLIGNLLNPKAAVFYMALIPGFLQPDHASPTVQALIFGTGHVIVSVLVHGLIVLGAASATGFFRERGPALRLPITLSLVAIAAWMAWQTRG